MWLGAEKLLEAPKRALSSRLRWITLIVTTAIIAVLVLPPIGVLIFSTFRSTQGRLPFEDTPFTLNNYVEVFTSHLAYSLIWNTVLYAVGSVAISIILATVFAWFLERTRLPARTVFFVMVLTPMAIPAIVSTMGWTLLANPTNGLINVAIRTIFGMDGRGPLNIYSIPGMVLVTGLQFVPVVYIMISGVFSRLDPSFEEASKASGASTFTTFRRVSLPLLMPALLAAVIYFLVLSIEVFEIPGMLGMPQNIFVFSTVIYYYLHLTMGLPDYGVASTYAIILLFIAGILIFLYSRYVRQSSRFATVTGRGFRPQLIELGKWKFIPIVLILVYFVFAVALPFLILVWQSFAPRFVLPSISAISSLNLDAYQRMFHYPQLWVAIKNTLIFAAITGVAVMIIVTIASWLSVRKVVKGAWVPERMAFLVLGVPAIVVALAMIFLYVSLPIPIYGTLGIIILAGITVCLPFGTRMMGAAFLQIHKELEEASETSGAGYFSTFIHVVLPLLKPSVFRGFLWVFVRCIRETTITLMLYGIGTQTVAVTLWFLWVQDTDTPLASAIAIPMVIVAAILTYFVARGTMFQDQSSGGNVL